MYEHTATPAPWGLWATLGFSLIIAACFVLIQTLGAIVFVAIQGGSDRYADIGAVAASLQTNGLLIASVTCVTTLATVGLIVLFVRLRRRVTVRQYLYLHPPRARTLMSWLGVVLLFAIAWDVLTYLIDKPIIPEFLLAAYQTARFPPLLWLALVVAAPLAEEAFFRGFLFEGIRYSRLGTPGAIVLTSFSWAAIHLQYGLYEIATVFVLGLMLSIARLQTHSLYTAIAMHAFANLLATLEVAVYLRYFAGGA